MQEKTLLIGNWKMNLTVQEASLYVHKLNKELTNHRNVEISLAPTMLCLQPLSLQIDRKKFSLSAQNMYWRDDGAFTGEVSAHQLHGLVKYAIIGHSERRHVFHEHDKDIRAKVQAAFRNDIIPVLCIGETATEHSEGETIAVLHDQLIGGLANVTAEEVASMVIAYEPVWAISGGKDFSHHAVATPDDVKTANKAIRQQIEHLFGKKTAKAVRILYGGSTNGSNAASFLTVKDLDGLLIGGASLNSDEFSTMVAAAHKRR
jgi:triosephosphate isomerase